MWDASVLSLTQPFSLSLTFCLKSIQNILTDLSSEELLNFRMLFCHWESKVTLKQALEGDVLDFVDRIIEILGKKTATIQEV